MIAKVVKLADIDHNSDPTRGNGMPEKVLIARRSKSLEILLSERKS